MSTPSNVVRLADHREPPARSQYERYQLPFFNGKNHSTWAVQPTGDYGRDCEIGEAYAIEFLALCNGTVGWTALLPQIVADMIRAGPDGTWPDGGAKVNGLVVGFMGTIGRALARSVALIVR